MAKDKSTKTEPKKAEVKAEVKNVQKIEDIRNKIQATPPPAEFLEQKLDTASVIAQSRNLFETRAASTTLITDEQVEAVDDIISLVEDGATWDESEELRISFSKCANSFPKGPVLTSALQLICGKIVEYSPKEVPIFKIGSKIGTRFIYQDDLGFIKATGRAPITAADAAADPNLKPDPVGQKTFLSHCGKCDLDFWAPEPGHQLHCPACSANLKKKTKKSSTKISSTEDAVETLKKRLDSYTKMADDAKDGPAKDIMLEKVKDIKDKINKLTKAA
jgi:hypothetical protein